MKRLALLALLFCTSAFAATDNSDGSVTFTQEEAINLLDNFQQMSSDAQQYQVDRTTALRVLEKMQDELNRLQKSKCL